MHCDKQIMPDSLILNQNTCRWYFYAFVQGIYDIPTIDATGPEDTRQTVSFSGNYANKTAFVYLRPITIGKLINRSRCG